jgi:hypothetical protein
LNKFSLFFTCEPPINLTFPYWLPQLEGLQEEEAAVRETAQESVDSVVLIRLQNLVDEIQRKPHKISTADWGGSFKAFKDISVGRSYCSTLDGVPPWQSVLREPWGAPSILSPKNVNDWEAQSHSVLTRFDLRSVIRRGGVCEIDLPNREIALLDSECETFIHWAGQFCKIASLSKPERPF